MKNAHGLSRDIPEHVARAVRQRDGFGCVCCGKALYTYEHLDPEFRDARAHEVSGIVLLCEGCQGKKTRGLLSKETVRRAAANPTCRQLGFSFEAFDLAASPPEIVVGTAKFTDINVLIRLMGDEVLSVAPPEGPGGPFRITARIADREGCTVFEIISNEWRTRADNWDVEIVGRRITIRKAPREIVLQVRSDPPRRLVIERLDMEHQGARISAREGHDISASSPMGRTFSSKGGIFFSCDVGIDVTDEGISLGLGMERGGVFFEQITLGRPRPKPYEGLRRNASCPCGSGERFKHCHGKL